MSCNCEKKADRPHPRDYSTHRQTPWTDNDSSLQLIRMALESSVLCILYIQVKRFSTESADGQTDGRYQVHYLPCFAIDNNLSNQKAILSILAEHGEDQLPCMFAVKSLYYLEYLHTCAIWWIQVPAAILVTKSNSLITCIISLMACVVNFSSIKMAFQVHVCICSFLRGSTVYLCKNPFNWNLF